MRGLRLEFVIRKKVLWEAKIGHIFVLNIRHRRSRFSVLKINILFLSCNNTSCQIVVKIFDGAHKVEVLDDEPCEECSTKLLSAEFLSGKAPEALNGETKHIGCIFCDEVFAKLVSVKVSY